MHDVETFEVIDSTSSFARRNLGELADRKVISADFQTDGHGQFGRKWLSSNKNGGNCYISIILKPENIEHLDELTKYSSLITIETLKKYGLSGILKYPNDVIINNKKIAGILAESVFIGNTLRGVIVGIGVNLNLEAEEINMINIVDIAATSIYNETGKNVDKNEFITHLLDNFFGNYEEFLKNGTGEIK